MVNTFYYLNNIIERQSTFKVATSQKEQHIMIYIFLNIQRDKH